MARAACRRDAKDIVAHFHGLDLDDDSVRYLRFHAQRYSFLLELLDRLTATPERDGALTRHRILDVGPSALTQFMRDNDMAAVIDSLGFEDHRFKCRKNDTHIQYDLTRTGDQSSWPRAEAYDIVIIAEVLEHLVVSPSSVFKFLSCLLRPEGTLIVQTPNACSLPKRLRMLVGQNPFEMIRESQPAAGHLREYTVDELATLAGTAGLAVHSFSVENYFLRETWTSRTFRALAPFFPVRLRDGITMCLRRAGAG